MIPNEEEVKYHSLTFSIEQSERAKFICGDQQPLLATKNEHFAHYTKKDFCEQFLNQALIYEDNRREQRRRSKQADELNRPMKKQVNVLDSMMCFKIELD